MTRDQRQLTEILEMAEQARDAAYDLFSRRMDTQRNVESFVLLHDAYMALERACDYLMVAVDKATEKKSSDQNTVAIEMMVRSGMATVVEDGRRPAKPKQPGKVLPFRTRKER